MSTVFPKKTRIVWNDIPNEKPKKLPSDLFYWYQFVGTEVLQDVLVTEHRFVESGKLDSIHSSVISTNTFERYFIDEQAAQEWIDYISGWALKRGWSLTCSIHDS